MNDGTTAEALCINDYDLRKQATVEHTRLDYCQSLLVSQTNYTLMYLPDHHTGFGHAAVKRHLEDEKLTARKMPAFDSSVAAAMLH